MSRRHSRMVMRLEADTFTCRSSLGSFQRCPRRGAAIQAGDKEDIPVADRSEFIAAVLAAVANDSATGYRDEAMAQGDQAGQQSRLDASVHVTGESGTGQGSAGALVHTAPPRKTRSLASMRGHSETCSNRTVRSREGSFTGAVAGRNRKIEEGHRRHACWTKFRNGCAMQFQNC